MKKLTPSQITLLVALAVLLVIVGVGVNRAMSNRSHLEKHNDCTLNALSTGQPTSVCGSTP